jgi:hypothetical protein
MEERRNKPHNVKGAAEGLFIEIIFYYFLVSRVSFLRVSYLIFPYF